MEYLSSAYKSARSMVGPCSCLVAALSVFVAAAKEGQYGSNEWWSGEPIVHWVYGLAPSEQSTPVTVSVRCVDAGGKPLVWPCEVLADCRPWGFRRLVALDADGRCDLRGPLGDWSFEVSARTPAGPILFSTHGAKVTGDTTVRLTPPAKTTRLVFRDTDAGDMAGLLLGRRLQPAEEAALPRIFFMPMASPGAPPLLTGGSLPPAQTVAEVRVHPGQDVIVGLVAAPRPAEEGYALFARHRRDGDPHLGVDTRELATLAIDVRTDWPDMHVEVIGLGQEEVPVGLYVPLLRPGTYEIRIRPGVSRLGLRTRDGAFVPTVHDLAPGSRIEAVYRGPFSASPAVLRWDRGYMSVWFDITDQNGNALISCPGRGRLLLRRSGTTTYDEELTRSDGRLAEIIRDWGESWAERPLEYEYILESAMTGRITARGTLDPQRTINRDLHVRYQTPRFEFLAREESLNAAVVAQIMERMHDALSASIAGPVRASHGGRFRLQCAAPWGLAWSSGDTIALDIYAARWFWPVPAGQAVGVMLHEFGHSYSLVPPHNSPFWGEDEGQGFATWLAYQGLRSVYGERAYQAFRMEQNTNLLAADVDHRVSGFMFVMDYVDQRYGAKVNREMYRILYAGQGDLRGRIEQDAELRTEHQRMAVLHSALTGRNLAWLYRWGRCDVADETVAAALKRLEPLADR